MINYSVIMRGNPLDKNQPKKAYGVTQYTEVMDINKFAEHIASHGSVYKRSDIIAILTMMVDCMREQLLNGVKIQLGELGDFSASINSEGVDNAQDYNPDIHVKKLNVNWTPGDRFENLLGDAVFNQVATRAATKALLKAVKAGETTVDLSNLNSGGSSNNGGSSSGGSGNDDDENGDNDLGENPLG